MIQSYFNIPHEVRNLLDQLLLRLRVTKTTTGTTTLLSKYPKVEASTIRRSGAREQLI